MTKRSTFYFVAGASGSGKTAIIKDLHAMLDNSVIIYDFDDIGVPKNTDKKWRQEATEKWLQKLLSDGKSACLLGQMVLGEILACPSAKQIDKVNFCFLDVDDLKRIQRLKNHDTYSINQNILNWASWLRMHHQDPQWFQHVLKDDCWDELDFSFWDKLKSCDNKANIKLLDTTKLSINEVAKLVADWVSEKDSGTPKPIPNTPYKLYKNLPNSFDIIDEKLFAFNKKCVPATQNPEVIDQHYLIKENEEVIAGICADVYIWKILYISLLFVDEKHRNRDLGTLLIQKVEDEARAIGATLAHTDTFDFQAKGFYLKQGYEIFGILDDCPKGHKRYYLKKVL